MLRAALKDIESDDQAIGILKKHYLEGERQERQEIDQVFSQIKKESIPVLFDILKESERRSVRRSAIEILINFQAETIPFIKKILKDPATEWFVLRNAIFILGEIGDDRDSTEILPFMEHSKDRVREETLLAIKKLMGGNGLDYYIQGLKDKEAGVKNKAISILGSLDCIDQQILYYFAALLLQDKTKSGDDIESVQLSVLKALENVDGSMKWNDKNTIQELLLNILKEEKSSIAKVFIKKDVRSPELYAAVRSTLNKIGSDEIRKKLS